QDELGQILMEIGTAEAVSVGEVLAREWRMLEQPPIGHRDNDLLWRAELILRQLASLAEKPDARTAFVRGLEEDQLELRRLGRLLFITDHQIAFVGSIGVGKSTALCRLTGLEVSAAASKVPAPVLESGGGGVTICDVHVRQGLGYGLIVEPRSDEDV